MLNVTGKRLTSDLTGDREYETQLALAQSLITNFGIIKMEYYVILQIQYC